MTFEEVNSKSKKLVGDSEKVFKLLTETGKTQTEISEVTNIPQGLLSKLASKKQSIEKSSFGTIATLTAYYDFLQEEGQG